MIFNYGSINIDHIYRVPHFVRPGETISSLSYERTLGGKGANQSIALGRAGAEVVHLGRINKMDSWVLDILDEAGVDISCMEIVDHDSTGHAVIQVDGQAENSIVLHPGANHGFSVERLEPIFLRAKKGDWLLIQNECNSLEKVINLAHRLGLNIAFNPAPMDSKVLELPLQNIHLLFLNRREAAELVGVKISESITNVLDRLQERFPTTEIVLTLGIDGVQYQHNQVRFQLPAYQVNAVDTTGAGDTFVGYFLAGRVRGLDVMNCLRQANAASALSIQKKGASSSIPLAKTVVRMEKNITDLNNLGPCVELSSTTL